MNRRGVFNLVSKYTKTDFKSVSFLIDCVDAIVQNEIQGDFVECGVWRGGSVIAMIKALEQHKATRKIWLYDTFEGMTEPDEHDALHIRNRFHKAKETSTDARFLCLCDEDETISNIKRLTDYDFNLLNIVKGDVLKTLETSIPEKIALLRLDTDWYASTKKELEVLYPKLSPKGYLIIDDANCMEGAKKAILEYFGKTDFPIISKYGAVGFKKSDYDRKYKIFLE